MKICFQLVLKDDITVVSTEDDTMKKQKNLRDDKRNVSYLAIVGILIAFLLLIF
ncbi:hypothetical protein FD03_GL000030 [Companilactobacillus nodensis DSM 19682 = JCM 14932 = NBRC 107160]|uniref:Uncharacterized protein n=1 Tax=Companilactobacillus nodensis DSM 19682 = JCM 14932 = NBRC 107160 TaxID=1423775 RepID=A0A0R1K994_9LACO|nr:hypothetical protein FD03_GL000030 [Companilactobacillus nodensis DSM 19682 = JCM 14932 = NBRC 107160]